MAWTPLTVNLAESRELPKLDPVKVKESPAERLAGLMLVTSGEYEVDLVKLQEPVQVARSVSLPYKVNSFELSAVEPTSDVMQVNVESFISSSISHM